MRIWHERLIPNLCRQHLLAMWREGLGCWKIVNGDVDGGGYRNHPAVKEFMGNSLILAGILTEVREEMVRRHYHPKEFQRGNVFTSSNTYKPWQTLDQQIEVLKNKHCDCKL